MRRPRGLVEAAAVVPPPPAPTPGSFTTATYRRAVEGARLGKGRKR